MKPRLILVFSAIVLGITAFTLTAPDSEPELVPMSFAYEPAPIILRPAHLQSSSAAEGTTTTTAAPTTTAPPRNDIQEPASEPLSAPLSAPTQPAGGWDWNPILSCIRHQEQGAAGYATNTGNGYYGGYQFSQSTWNAAAARAGMGEWVGIGPHTAPPEIQDRLAIQLLGEGTIKLHWPITGPKCIHLLPY